MTNQTVLVVGGFPSIQRMFVHHGWVPVDDVDDADLVQFCGGSDVYPGMYGETPLPETRFDTERDIYEKAMFELALSKGLAMTGICRGAQFLHVMNKGKLWQHVIGHANGTNHLAFLDCSLFSNPNKMAKQLKANTVTVSSTHHQMMREGPGKVVMTAIKAVSKATPERTLVGLGKEPDVEAVWHETTRSFCYQPHPEYFAPTDPCQVLYFQCIKDFLFNTKRKGVQ